MTSSQYKTLLLFVFISTILINCGGGNSQTHQQADTTLVSIGGLIQNREAPIPSQCYTKTEGHHNPCYTCHQSYTDGRANVQNDADLQGDYAFSWLGVKNHWLNLFKDRSQQVSAISDDEILNYISQDNYTPLKAKLESDVNWKGYIPDLANYQSTTEAFSENGLAKDGSAWVAFNYKPLPSTFWPTNGSTDDVLLRLPKIFRASNSCANLSESIDVYYANLALLEATIKQLTEISTPEIDENKICVDLNGDSQLGRITQITTLPDHYVGDASTIKRHDTLYPLGTEFLHSVRYVGVSDVGDIYTPPRMKELRYMKKTHFFNKGELSGAYKLEAIEKEDEIIPTYKNTRHGLLNRFGWLVLGFIEDKKGALRQQTHEENKFCMGCHSTVGTTIDQTFAFPRKITGAKGWGYINLKNMVDVPNYGETKGEILTYLKRAGGGSEFRSNTEMWQRWFNPDGSLKEDEINAADVYALITPSRERALTLNKAYKVIVDEQSFIYGRDAIVAPPGNVYDNVPIENPPLTEDNRYQWDIRLQW